MMRFASGLAAAVLAVGCPFSAVTAQTLTAIRAGRLVDVERGEVRRDQLVLQGGDRILDQAGPVVGRDDLDAAVYRPSWSHRLSYSPGR